jgi:hypothetical protein
MMNKFLVILALVFCTSIVWAQQLQFEHTMYEFGRIKEIDGPVEHKYIFENILDKPVIITQVKASCGCTTTDWTKDTIMPGQNGFVIGAFNPHNRPGYFEKSVHVSFSDTALSTELKFKGFVIARQQTIKEEFPNKVGNVSFSTALKDLGPLSPGTIIETDIKAYNHTKAPITISKFDINNRLKMQVPVLIEPEKEVVLKFSFLAPINGVYGPITEEITLITDDLLSPKKSLKFSANIADFVPDSIKDFSKMPKMQLDKSFLQFDTIQTGKIVMQEIEIHNTGKQDLLIRKIMSEATYVKAEVDKKVIKAGNRTKLKIAINTEGILGKDAKIITIYSNDPSEPIKKIPVRAIIVR